MGQHQTFTYSTLQLLDGLGLEQSPNAWFDSPLTFKAFEAPPVVGGLLPFSHPIVSNDRPSPRSSLAVHDAVFTEIFKRSPDAMTLSTLEEGRFVAANERFLEFSEYTREDIIGSTSIEIKLWPEPTDRLHLLQKLKQQGALYNEEGGFLTKSGQHKIVRVSAEIIPVDNIPYILCSIRDITQEKKAEEELKLANERDRLLGEISLKIRQSLDLKQILQATVTEVREFLGVERVFVTHFGNDKIGRVEAEAILAPFPSLAGEVVEKDVYDEALIAYQHHPIRVINDVETMPEASRLRAFLQRFQVNAALGVPIMIDGALWGVLVAQQCTDPRPWTDIEQQLLLRLATQVAIAIQQSELYSKVQFLNTHLEQQVQERTMELEQRGRELEKRRQELEELGEFRDFLLHAVTHDLQTSAVGMTMLLKSLDCQAAAESIRVPRGLVSNMIRAGNTQQRKLEAIQEVYRIKIQGLSLHPQVIDMYSLANHVIAPLESHIDKSDALVENEISSQLPKVQGDFSQLERVLKHLITNAIAHNPPGVKVQLHGTTEPPSSSSSDQSWLYVQVTDNGRGIDAQQCDRIFQLRSNCPESPQYGGIQLGLYLCEQIINAHGGFIGIYSTVGQGTTVWFKLPCA